MSDEAIVEPLINKEDREDLERSRKSAEECEVEKPWYKCVGPGLITGAADDDPSGVGTYSANGAQFGYGLLWLVPVCIPLMIAVQEMCGRLAAVTGKGLAAVINENYPKWVLYSTMALLIFANVFNVYADMNVMAASAQMLLGVPSWAAIVVMTVLMITLQILVPYKTYSSVLKWLCLALLGYVVVVFMPGMKVDWAAMARGLVVPTFDFKTDTILAAVAFLGTTISPYLFFWQAGETVEEEISNRIEDEPGERHEPVTTQEIRRIRADTAVGMVTSQIVAMFIIVAAAGTLNATGKTHIETAQDAAKALQPLGPAAVWIFSLCMIGTGLLAIPTLAGSAAYSVAETFGWRYGLYRRFSRARGFYATIALVITVGSVLNFFNAMSPIKALVLSAALNGAVAPPLIVLLLLLCNNRKVVGSKVNGPWSNLFGWLTVALMGPAAVYLIVAMVQGKA